MTEDEIRDLLREMGDEPVPADSVRRVRLAVAERTQPRTAIWWRAAALLAAAACVALLILWWREPSAVWRPAPPAVAREQIVLPTEAASAPVRVQSRPQAPMRAVAKRARRRVERKPATAADVVIRIETQDPDVLILLIGD